MESVKNHLTTFLPDNIVKIIDVTATEMGERADAIYKKDLYEAIGF